MPPLRGEGIEENDVLGEPGRSRGVMGVNEPKALYVTEGEGRKLWVTGELMTFEASGEGTGGA